MPFVPPATAGPTNTMFDFRAAASGAHARRANQADQLRAMLGISNEEQVPMTAALGGRFGSRFAPGQYPEECGIVYGREPRANGFEMRC